jgi:hypothetical protein
MMDNKITRLLALFNLHDVVESDFLLVNQQWITRLDNLFRFNQYANYETQNLIVIDGVLHQTKFARILLKELFWGLRVGGRLIIAPGSDENKQLAWRTRQWLFTLFDQDIQIETALLEGKSVLLGIKLRRSLAENDQITRWSFGVITHGKNNNALLDFVSSVANQNIPEFEVIICGKWLPDLPERLPKNVPVHFLSCKEYDEYGWITRKKNLICESANYENIAVFHDRYMLATDWYFGMIKYGNHFEVLSCKNQLTNGTRSEDWARYPGNALSRASLPYATRRSFDNRTFPVMMQYSDWDDQVYIPGGAIIIKRSIWMKCKWDERLFWMEKEDVVFSHEQIFKGILPRFNMNSVLITLVKKGNSRYSFSINKVKLGRVRPWFLFVLSKMRCIWRR